MIVGPSFCCLGALEAKQVMTVAENRVDNMRSAVARSASNAVVPFNVLETRNRDLLGAFGYVFRQDSLGSLRSALRNWIHDENVFFSPSGECAIAQVLSLLPQKEVVMPAWICHQVKTAVRVAGKRIIFVDLAKNSINATSAEYEEAARPGRILLIAHLFGVPTDVEAICELARTRDCLTIEDAVPAIGGRQNGRLLGTFADFGVFSFEQSKRIPAFRGGFIVANNTKHFEVAKLERHRVTPTTQSMPYLPLAKAFLQNFATSPLIYRHVTRRVFPLRPRLRQLLKKRATDEGSSVVSVPSAQGSPLPEAPQKAPLTPFYTQEIHPYQAQLALRMIRRIDKIGEKVAELGDVYERHFAGSGITTFLPAGANKAGLMRFPIAFPGRKRSEVLKLTADRGVYLKVLWSEEEDCEGLPNCLWAARNLILLPLYTALSADSAAGIAQTLLEIANGFSREENLVYAESR
jgi:dTDP-4-amino-4,6-dideoxygalactose transaminase